jgi:hypothetical protein
MASVNLNYSENRGQSQAGARFRPFRGKKRLENAIHNIPFHTMTGICRGQQHVITGLNL